MRNGSQKQVIAFKNITWLVDCVVHVYKEVRLIVHSHVRYITYHLYVTLQQFGHKRL